MIDARHWPAQSAPVLSNLALPTSRRGTLLAYLGDGRLAHYVLSILSSGQASF